MAPATLQFEFRQDDGRAVYRLVSDPFGAPPFAGPAGRDWDAFVVQGDDATYEWRTGADVVRERAKRLVARGCPTDAVRRAFARSDYLQRLDEVLEECGQDDDELAFDVDVDRYEYILEELASGRADRSTGDDDRWSYSDSENDTHFADASRALELPDWVERDEADDGGPGSGYTAQFLVLVAGRTLDDLGAWLRARADAGKGR